MIYFVIHFPPCTLITLIGESNEERSFNNGITSARASFLGIGQNLGKVPGVSEEEAQDDIEQAIAEARAEKIRKRSKLSS